MEYKLTRQGIDKIGTQLTVLLPKIYNKLQKILANDSKGKFDCLKDFVDFSNFELFLVPQSGISASTYDQVSKVTQSASLSELTSSDKHMMQFDIWFLFKLLPGETIHRDLAIAWNALQEALFTARPKTKGAAIGLCMDIYPESTRFAIPGTCQVLTLFCRFNVTAADVEPV